MGLFKKLGEKVKRVASLKNVVGIVTGNYLGVAKDALRVATTNKPVKNQPAEQDTTFFQQPPVIPESMENYLTVKGDEQKQKLTNKLAQKKEVQDAADQVTGFMSGVYLKALWLKYKAWFIAGFIALGAFLVYWFGFRNKNQSGSRARRRR
ncbi:hypothetical protein [Flavobacterium aquiphilum]|uniref:hypothetical protein n=1 Tax=Flavobacterium aquiphilum TaxID=3003261 RepID=UPI00247FBFA1|nr:hypothetical protein [Flavobacterium aquiphilum]